MALLDQEGSAASLQARSEALQLATEWKERLYALRAAKVARECFAKRNAAMDGRLLLEEFFQWTRDNDGANLMLWLPSMQKMEPYLFAEEGEGRRLAPPPQPPKALLGANNIISYSLAVHNRFTCRGCGQSPIRGTRFTCKTCSHWHMCSMCVREGREPFAKQGMSSVVLPYMQLTRLFFSTCKDA